MKKYLFLVFGSLLTTTAFAQGYTVTLQAPGYKNGIAYLTYYMGSNFNIEDSAAVTPGGVAVFKANKKLEPGIYAAFLPGKSLRVEFLVGSEQQINIKTDTTDIVNKTVITGSKENVLYLQYQKFISQKGDQFEKEKKAYNQSRTKADSALHQKNLDALSKEMTDYRLKIMREQPESMMAVLFNAMKEPEVLIKKPRTRQDSVNNYNYYKAHYWDGITFMDDRIIRTPFFLPKLERYYRDVVSPVADSINKDIDYKLLLARNAPEMYKYLLNWLTDEFINPKYMGQDAVFVHLYEVYHSQGKSSWLNSDQMEKVSRRANMLMWNQIGEKAADLTLSDTASKPAALFNLQADYTVVIFWDPHCGHCKEEVPRLDSIYNAKWKSKNVKIFAVLTPDDKGDEILKDWKKFIAENGLADWTNVYQTKQAEEEDRVAQKPSFRQLYDVTMTPTLFLLDKDKNIIAKKLSIRQMDDLLEYKWNNKNQN